MPAEDSEKLATCLVGYGYWGQNQARNIAASSRTDLRFIVETVDGRSRQASAAHPDVPVVADLDEALPNTQAVVIATPADTHHEVARRAMEAGKHVLVEKPLAMDVEQARDLLAAAEQHHVQLSVGHTFLYSSPIRRLRAMVDDGELGDLRYMSFQRRSLGRIRPDCNVMWNLAPHDISIALHLLDETPDEVWATGFTFLQPGIEDVVFATMRMPSGVGVGLHVSWLDPRKTRQLTVVGADKMAVYDDVSIERTIQAFDSGVETPESGLGDFDSMADWQWKTRGRGCADTSTGAMGTPAPTDRRVRRGLSHRCPDRHRRGPRARGRRGARRARRQPGRRRPARPTRRRTDLMSTSDPSSRVAEDTIAGDDVAIAPFCVVGLDGPSERVEFRGAATIRSHTVIYRATTLGIGFATGHHVLVREHTQIGDQVSIGSSTVIEHHVLIHDRVRIHSQAFVPEFTVLEEGCWLGPGVRITNARYPNPPDTKDNLEGVTVGVGAVIGAGSVILPGVTIGAGALVGAGTVVVRDVPPNARIVGNPGRRLETT